jgi:SAM-dependent methyltransferase
MPLHRDANQPGAGTPVSSDAATAYDALPYPSRPHPFSHPDRLATLARLHGMTPPDVAHARILEIGCADGGNLLPMAWHLPRTSCVGIDISPRQIEMGRQHVTALDLQNVALRAADLMTFQDDEPFDYIMAHGVMSWVPPAVQDRLLETIRQHLSPQGVAYVSYNVQPGFDRNQMMRDMMLFHTRHISDPEERARRALEFVSFLAEAGAQVGNEEAHRLRRFHEQITAQDDWVTYVFHEYLEAYNQPMTLQTFVQRSRDAALQYLCDADPVPLDVRRLPGDMATQVQAWSTDRVEVEQYMDFVCHTAFRRSLVCRHDAPVQAEWDPAALATLHVTSRARPLLETDPSAPSADRFRLSSGDVYTAPSRPVAKILLYLAEAWPAACDFQTLAAAVPETGLAEMLLTLFRTGAVDLHALAPACAATVSEYPSVSPLIRWQARRGKHVSNAFHQLVALDDEVARLLLPLLDGTRDVPTLARWLEQAIQESGLRLDYQGRPLREQGKLAEILPSFVRFHLDKALDVALLDS